MHQTKALDDFNNDVVSIITAYQALGQMTPASPFNAYVTLLAKPQRDTGF